MLIARRLREQLLMTVTQLQPCVVNTKIVKEAYTHKRCVQKKYFYQHSRNLSAFYAGDAVYSRIDNRWFSAVVVQQDVIPRSYIIAAENEYNIGAIAAIHENVYLKRNVQKQILIRVN